MTSRIHARLKVARDDFTLDVDLDLPGQGVSALFGASGSGKTTCLRCLAGLERAGEAYIEVAGTVWQDSAKGIFVPPHQRPIGYVFQEASLFSHLSVRGNLEFGWKRIDPATRRINLQQACELLGIDHLLERKADTLSGGERQRVGIARALLTSPSLLLMDEPLAALDAPRKREILPYLERLHDELRIPLVYVSHAQEEVARLADHLVLLEHGKVLASGPLNQTLARLDLPLAQDEDAGVVIEGRTGAYDETYQLLDLHLPDSELRLRIPHAPLPAGSTLRIRIQARDISLSLTENNHSSIINRLPVTLRALGEQGNPAQMLVSLDAAGHPLLARVTRYSSDQLGLQPGLQLWAQIKGVALLGHH